jgi:hypothetical protein
VVFDNLAVFTGAAFGDATKFDDSVFNGWVLFNGESKEKRTAELGASPELGVRIRRHGTRMAQNLIVS